MSSDNNKDQKLFESLRNAPAEISLERVEAIIKGFPTLPSSPQVGNDWTNFLNFKNLIMMSIPISIAIGLLMINPSDEISQQNIHVDNLPSDVTLNTRIENELAQLELEPINALPPLQNRHKPKTSIVEYVDSEKVDTVSFPEPIKKEASKISENEKSVSIPDSIQDPDNSGGWVKIIPPINPDVNDDLPDLSNSELRKLKRTLYRNLKQDGLIFSKNEFVEIKLLGNEILVNDVAVNSEQLLRYSALTRKVGKGPNRRIQIDPQFIKVGDFTEEGFKGEGFGTFTETFARDPLSPLQPTHPSSWEEEDDFFSDEVSSLDLFAEDLLGTRLKSGSTQSLFSFNISYEKAKILHEQLYNMLIADGLIKARQDFVLVELPKDMIRVNDKELSQELYSKYEKLFSKNKIKHGNQRQLRLSEHSIRIGDFSRGSFSGTSAEIRD